MLHSRLQSKFPVLKFLAADKAARPKVQVRFFSMKALNIHQTKRCSNELFLCFKQTENDKCTLAAPLPTRFHPYRLSSTHQQPVISPLSPPHTQSPAPTSSLCHVASMHVRSLSISFSRAPLISLCSRMWAEQAASPTLKITTSV